MSTYMGVTNFKKTVRFFGPPCISIYYRIVVCRSGSTFVSVNKVMPGPVSTGMGDHVRASTPGAENLSKYVTSHPGQLSTGPRAAMLCGWGVKAGMFRVWVAGKTV